MAPFAAVRVAENTEGFSMELGAHIKEHRKEKGLSQDDLAEAIYVSRQTISNWETGRTYPDVQSLLLLSYVFDVTVDSLIKGDVEAMAEKMDQAVKEYRRVSTVAVVSAVLCMVLVFWGAMQLVWGDNVVLTVVLAAAALLSMLISMGRLETLKKQHDLATYREILAFSRGEQVDRDTIAGRREREMKPWVKGVRNSFLIVLGAGLGAAVGIGLGMLVKFLA